MKTILKSLWKDEEGAAALEYGLIAAGIALVIVGAFTPIGNQLATVFGNILTGIGG